MVNAILQGDALELAKTLPDNSIHCIVTSPPYWGLRDYGVDGQLGLEETPEQYLEKMVLLFRELKRILRQDGTLWLNMGDSYAGGGNGGGGSFAKDGIRTPMQGTDKNKRPAWKMGSNQIPSGLKPKDLCGIPWRVAFALQADGWYLRSDIIWSKPNPMPESVTDRPTKAHEYLFLLAKSPKYFYDAEAIREPNITETNYRNKAKEFQGGNAYLTPLGKNEREWNNPNGRNRRTVWEIASEPYLKAHFATFPTKLIEPCILAGTSARGVCPVCGSQWERVVGKPDFNQQPKRKTSKDAHLRNGDRTSAGQAWQEWRNENPNKLLGWQPTCNHTEQPIPATILDPFMGSGTTASVAKRLGRNWLGFELNPEYIKLALKRIEETQPPLIVENDVIITQQFEQLSF